MNDLDLPGATWLSLAEVALRLGTDAAHVRRLVRDGHLLAARPSGGGRPAVPEEFLAADGRPLPDLKGTITVLRDAGFTDGESLAWLFRPDDSLPGTPVQALREGRKTEVRRRAQALAL